MTHHPFTLISWRRNFLEGLLEALAEPLNAPGFSGNGEAERNGDLSSTVCIFPHNRPQRYLSAMLRKDGRFSRPLLLPVWHTVGGLFTGLSAGISSPRMEASRLDRVGLIFSLFRSEPLLRKFLCGSASFFGEKPRETREMEPHRFFPWGIRLADLFEECFIHAKTPQNFLYGQGQVTPFAAALLEHLGQLFSLYTEALDNRYWTTPGYDAFRVVRHLHGGGTLPDTFFAGKRIFIGGFFALTGTEEALFHHLWTTCRARIFLHGDSALVAARTTGNRPHWSCQPLHAWAERWGAPIELLGPSDAVDDEQPRLRYVEGYDLHAQLVALQNEFPDCSTQDAFDEISLSAEAENTAGTPGQRPDDDRDAVPTAFAADTAVILPESNLLMPTLHHLPHTDINVSMGYPLVRSPLFRLLDTIFRLQESKRIGGYYWKDLVELARHPYLKMLSVGGENNGTNAGSQGPETSLRRELHRFEQALREYNRAFAKPEEVLQVLYSLMPEEDLPSRPVMELLLRVFSVTLKGFEGLKTTAGLAAAMDALCRLLLECGMPLWKRFPIDAECLYRFIQSVVPELAGSAVSDEPLPADTVFLIARQLLQAERVPFDAAPLVGLQVMGVLETRLLNFRRVLILDATDDNLPGVTANDPLLPENLRPEIGLPSLKYREEVAAYHFFRLLMGSAEAVIFWQEGAETSGIQDGKQKRSRFVEELLWEEEKKAGRVFSHRGTDGPLTTLSAAVAPMAMERGAVPVTAKIRALLDEMLTRPVSASLLDSYIQCPVRFFHERLLRLALVDEVDEDSDPLMVGTLLHKAFQEFYEPYMNRHMDCGDEFCKNAFPALQGALRAQPGYMELSRTIPADSFAMLAKAADIRLERYLAGQPATTILALEYEFSGVCALPGRMVPLTGTADRLDRRGDALIVLDYKTGRLPDYDNGVWRHEGLWDQVASWTPSACGNLQADPLFSLAENLPSIQLPFYLYLLYDTAQRSPSPSFGPCNAASLNAGWIALASDGKEYTLFHEALAEEAREQAVSFQIPALIRFIIGHMAATPLLYPLPGKHCDWCPASNVCRRGT